MRSSTILMMVMASVGLAALEHGQVLVDLDGIEVPGANWPDLIIRIDDGAITSPNVLSQQRHGWAYRSLGIVSQDRAGGTITAVIPAPKKAADKVGSMSVRMAGATATVALEYCAYDRKARHKKFAGTGRVQALDQLARENALDAAVDFPCWRGPSSGGLTQPDAPALVTDPKQAGIRWVSGEEIAGYWGSTTYSNYNSPIVHAGAVLFAYGMPSGTESYSSGYGIGKEGPRKDLIKATDTFLALDASTGRTLWKHEEETGINHFVNRKRGVIASTPVADVSDPDERWQTAVCAFVGLDRCPRREDRQVVVATHLQGDGQSWRHGGRSDLG